MNTPLPPDPAWLDAQYNNRALVPDHAQYFERWARDSKAAREHLVCLPDLAYGHGPGETLDLFPAQRRDSDPLAPVLVFIHGGYWRSLDKSDHSFLAPAFVKQGACVVIPNYALCPAVTIPDITMQMVQALVWTYRHIAVHGGDPRRISVVGHSAGGHLAAMLLACEWSRFAPDLPEDLVYNALSISGVFDLEPLRHTPFLKDSLRLTPEQVRMGEPGLAAQGAARHRGGAGGAAERGRRRRERRVPAPGPAYPGHLGRGRGADLRAAAGAEPLQRAGRAGPAAPPAEQPGAPAAGPHMNRCSPAFSPPRIT